MPGRTPSSHVGRSEGRAASGTTRKCHAVSSEEMSQPAALPGSINTQAKKVAAFLRMVRSSSSTRTWRRRRVNSSRSAPLNPLRVPPESGNHDRSSRAGDRWMALGRQRLDWFVAQVLPVVAVVGYRSWRTTPSMPTYVIGLRDWSTRAQHDRGSRGWPRYLGRRGHSR